MPAKKSSKLFKSIQAFFLNLIFINFKLNLKIAEAPVAKKRPASRGGKKPKKGGKANKTKTKATKRKAQMKKKWTKTAQK